MDSKENIFKKFKNLSFTKQLSLIIGIFCIVWGLLFIYLSFTGEKLKDGEKIGEVTEYLSDKPKLSTGEVKVTKDIKYLNGAKYEVKYKNYLNQENNVLVLEPSSSLQIIDFIGKSYTILKDSIKVNGNNYNKDNPIKVSFEEDNSLKIEIPNNLAVNENVIEVTIKLQDKKENVKHYTSRDCYYNFVPSADNKYYEKKTPLSYLIDGNSYIKLEKK